MTTEKHITLENSHLSAEILPSLGGKIWTLLDRNSNTQWIWNNPSIPPAKVPAGANYDDHWSGGWEELFPNDAPGPFDGRTLPDHGEWWSHSWTHKKLSDGALHMQLETQSIRAKCEKTIRLDPNSPVLFVSYRIENLEPEEIRFLFKQHLAIALKPKHVIELPGGTVTPVDLDFSTRLTKPSPFPWPGTDVDLSRPSPPEEEKREFVYVENLPESWCGVRDAESGARLRLFYPGEIFPYVWIFMDLGGWRKYYTAVLEPCTNMPKDLTKAAAAGQCARLGPGKVLEFEVRVELS